MYQVCLVVLKSMRGYYEKVRFVLNPYEKCTANKMINGTQFTTQWYMDNDKGTYISEYVITGFIDITKYFLKS